ncbi:putative replication protein [Zea mays]|uniref:Putative replication protein n=1 Tax=Zea mays TaxID=4577 RepID=A0A1D6N8H8_MAIZE|nr:putative replication protein [Zea mays]ONM36879.1 putative replication protein [Zea mays]
MADAPYARVARSYETRRHNRLASARGDRSIMDFPSSFAASNRHRLRSRLHYRRSAQHTHITIPLEKTYIDALRGACKKRFIYNTTQTCIQSLLQGGKINLEPYQRPPSVLADLLSFDGDARSKRFLRLIRAYNSLFAFTSFGAAIDKAINNGTAPYVFKINGIVHHRIGTLLPRRGAMPKFAQLYIHDTDHETQNRLNMFEVDDGVAEQPEREITMALLDMLNDNNKLVKAFRYARERLEQAGNQKITLRLLGCDARQDVQYNLPSGGEVAAIVVGDYTADEYTYDVLVHDRNCGLRRVSCLHPSYMALQYPLLFPYGENGYHLGIRYCDDEDSVGTKRKYVTMLEFVRRHLHYRLHESNPYTCYGRLSAQVIVDAYSTIEGSRLQFIADHQKDLRSESVQGIADAIDRGLISADAVGGKMGDVLIPSLRCGNLSVTICVRVSRFWDFSDPQDDARLLHCDMVLLDEECEVWTTWLFLPCVLLDVCRGASVNVVLWGAQATLFPGERIYEDGQNSPQIVLFVGTLVKKYADGLCLTGSSPCKWYINPSIPEAETLMSSARGDHKPVKWNATVTSSQLISPVAEDQKVSYIKYLHPFENKGKEFLVTVTIRKIDNKWWYNSCRKCACTAVTHGDSYKCTNCDCANIAMPVQRKPLKLETQSV